MQWSVGELNRELGIVLNLLNSSYTRQDEMCRHERWGRNVKLDHNYLTYKKENTYMILMQLMLFQKHAREDDCRRIPSCLLVVEVSLANINHCSCSR